MRNKNCIKKTPQSTAESFCFYGGQLYATLGTDAEDVTGTLTLQILLAQAQRHLPHPHRFATFVQMEVIELKHIACFYIFGQQIFANMMSPFGFVRVLQHFDQGGNA